MLYNMLYEQNFEIRWSLFKRLCSQNVKNTIWSYTVEKLTGDLNHSTRRTSKGNYFFPFSRKQNFFICGNTSNKNAAVQACCV